MTRIKLHSDERSIPWGLRPVPDPGEGGEVVVCKFGGSSVADLDCMRAVAERLIDMWREGHGVVAVLSAMGDCTDHLVNLAHRISPCPQPRELDALLSIGESASCAAAALMIDAMGVPAISMTAAQAGVLTDQAHGCAQLAEIETRRILQPVGDRHIVLVTGFQGVAPNGDVTTLGRGGSDASAIALAAALGVRRCEIFTDVAGVFSADPRSVGAARPLPVIDYEEMLLLATSGAAVMQPRAVELAMAHDIEIHVRSTFSVERGTIIRKENPMLEQATIIGVAHRGEDQLYGVRDLGAGRLSELLARQGAALGTLVCRGHELWFTAPGAGEEAILAAIDATGGRMVAVEQLGSVSIVGRGIGSRPEFVTGVLSVLKRLGVVPHLVTSTPGRIICHLSSSGVEDAARALHTAFGLDDERPSRAAA